jgi:hypothetical protein
MQDSEAPLPELAMPSPFPGMNPYLEQDDAWEDFHPNFILRSQEALNAQIGANYVVKVEVRLLLHERSAEERRFFGIADVGVSEKAQRAASSASAALEAPLQLQLPAVEMEKQRFLEIRDRRNRRVVTVIELLSPTNKSPGQDRDDYLSKRRQILAGEMHLVEIDLRRGGKRPSPPDLPPCSYYALVSRRDDRPSVGVWPFGLRDPLPRIPVPLNSPDPPVWLDLKAVLDQAYDAAAYGRYIYDDHPDPPLNAADEEWAKTVLLEMDRSKGGSS